MHHLLLHRDRVREQLGLPGGVPRFVDAMQAAGSDAPPVEPHEEYTRWYNYARGPNYNPVWGNTTPLAYAVQQGNVQATQLLLLFGENVNDTIKGAALPLYTAYEHGECGRLTALLLQVHWVYTRGIDWRSQPSGALG